MRVLAMILTMVVVLCCVGILAHAAEFHVNQDGSGDFSRIQDAIEASVDGDVIIVHSGTYYENVQYGGKNIVLRSEHPEDRQTVASTIINGGGLGSVVEFSGTEDESCLLSGFTITNGSSGDGGGVSGGILYYAETKASIEHCLITGNTATDGGGV